MCLKLSRIIIQAHTAISGSVGLLFCVQRNSGRRHRRPRPLFERDQIAERTANDLAQLLQGKHGDVSVLFERIQRVIINRSAKAGTVSHYVSSWWPVINDLPHHISCLIKQLYVVF